jgi:hypothetical protein
VLDATGRIALAQNENDLADLAFSTPDRVRCLRDGRILFASAERHFPSLKSGDENREQLFAFAPDPRPAISPLIPPARLPSLPPALARFEVSPDEKQVLFSSDNGDVHVFTLSTGEIEKIPGSLYSGGEYPAPAWRKPGEFTYAARISPATGKPAGASESQARDAIILRRGHDETVLTDNWKPETIECFLQDGKPGNGPQISSPTPQKNPPGPSLSAHQP